MLGDTVIPGQQHRIDHVIAVISGSDPSGHSDNGQGTADPARDRAREPVKVRARSGSGHWSRSGHERSRVRGTSRPTPRISPAVPPGAPAPGALTPGAGRVATQKDRPRGELCKEGSNPGGNGKSSASAGSNDSQSTKESHTSSKPDA